MSSVIHEGDGGGAGQGGCGHWNAMVVSVTMRLCGSECVGVAVRAWVGEWRGVYGRGWGGGVRRGVGVACGGFVATTQPSGEPRKGSDIQKGVIRGGNRLRSPSPPPLQDTVPFPSFPDPRVSSLPDSPNSSSSQVCPSNIFLLLFVASLPPVFPSLHHSSFLLFHSTITLPPLLVPHAPNTMPLIPSIHHANLSSLSPSSAYLSYVCFLLLLPSHPRPFQPFIHN